MSKFITIKSILLLQFLSIVNCIERGKDLVQLPHELQFSWMKLLQLAHISTLSCIIPLGELRQILGKLANLSKLKEQFCNMSHS